MLQCAAHERAITETSLPFPLARRGKVRDVYDLGDRFLFVATDRISAFDVVLSPGIPDKGTILTQISNFWFDASATSRTICSRRTSSASRTTSARTTSCADAACS